MDEQDEQDKKMSTRLRVLTHYAGRQRPQHISYILYILYINVNV